MENARHYYSVEVSNVPNTYRNVMYRVRTWCHNWFFHLLPAETVIWSTILTLLGITSLWLNPKHPKASWLVMVVDEILWILYAIATCQWPFIFSALVYMAVALCNLRRTSGRRSFQ